MVQSAGNCGAGKGMVQASLFFRKRFSSPLLNVDSINRSFISRTSHEFYWKTQPLFIFKLVE